MKVAKLFLLFACQLYAMTSFGFVIDFMDKGNVYRSYEVETGTTLGDIMKDVPNPKSDDARFAGFTFKDWATSNATTHPVFVDRTQRVTDDMVVYAIYSRTNKDNWKQTTTVDVGDSVVIAEIDDSKKELSSITASGTKYGLGTQFSTNPSGTMILVVESGTANGTFAFKDTNTNKYLFWNSGNTLNEDANLSDNSSWKILQSSGRGLIQTYTKDGNGKVHYLIWNKDYSRFASYVYKSHGSGYYYTVFYKKLPSIEYSLEIISEEGEKSLSGMEVPAWKTDGSTILLNHTVNVNGDEVRNYCLEFDKAAYHTRWVAFRYDGITRKDDTGRTNAFQDDPKLPMDYWITNATFGDFTYGGTVYSLDRGHLCASEDRTFTEEANKQTFYMSNMSPQISNFNRGYWSSLEYLVQKLGRDNDYSDTLYIVKGGTIDNDNIIGKIDRKYNEQLRQVVVPKYYFVALLRMKKDPSKGDGYKAIAFCAEHKKYEDNSATSHPEFVMSINALEKFIGIDFFPNLPDDVEEAVENINVTNTVLKDWGFDVKPSADDYPFVYHDVSGIREISLTPALSSREGVTYNLQGQRVNGQFLRSVDAQASLQAETQKGIIIIGNKKYIR